MWSARLLSPLCSQSLRRRAARRPTPIQSANSGGSRKTKRSPMAAQFSLNGSRLFRGSLVTAVAVGTAFASVAVLGITSAPVASAAATAPAAAQCNPPDGYPTTAPAGKGQEVSCNISIVNSVATNGATSSTITTTACLAAAGVLPPAGCTTTVVGSTQLVSTVNQCNGIIVGGGSNLTCNVTLTNDIASGTPTSGATVNQCIGSGAGGGTQPTVVCAPVASTTNATVTQCNGSGNGGGGSIRVQCTVIGDESAVPVTINQCNGSSNGGGSTVTCTTTIANDFIASVATTTTTPSSGAGGSSTAGTSGAGGPTPSGSGATGLTGSAPGAGGSTGAPTSVKAAAVVPTGAPQTGLGGASHSRNDALVFAGMFALIGAGLALALGISRRRVPAVPDVDERA